jgi:hypothetical protein
MNYMPLARARLPVLQRLCKSKFSSLERLEEEGLGRNSMALRHPIDDDGVDRSLGLGPVGHGCRPLNDNNYTYSASYIK